MEFVSYIVMGVEVVFIIISLILTKLKASKAKKNGMSAESAIMTSTLLAKIPKLVTQAETMFGSGKGANKLAWVVQQLTIDALKEGFSLDEETITKAINDVVETTNNVNVTRIVN